MAKSNLDSQQFFINRELSWLEFNNRVLGEGLSEDLPLLERLKFLAIVSSNLDEFFMVRVAGLMQQRTANIRRRDDSGMTAVQQLSEISKRTHQMVAVQSLGIKTVFDKLIKHDLHLYDASDWSPEQRKFIELLFKRDVLPILTPLGMQELDPCPLLPDRQLHIAALVKRKSSSKDGIENDGDEPSERIVVVAVPTQFSRFVNMPSEKGTHLSRLEDVISENLGVLLEGVEIIATGVFRITRDADVSIQDDDASDLLQAVEEAVLARRRRKVIRVEIGAVIDRRLKKWLVDWLEINADDVYEIDGMLDATALWEVVGQSGFDNLKSPEWPPQPPQDLFGENDIWQAIQSHDVMLFHPYESFDPVVHLLEKAAKDPDVFAIKQTLYRTSGGSSIVRALAKAAANGKEVTVLVELKARFDEAQNVNWARHLEDAGCHVIYGIAGLKTHAKALLIVRRESNRIRRYVHLSTGNYNDKTARLYSDIGLMTCDRDFAADVAAFFNLLTGDSETVGWSKLTIAPISLRQRLMELIEREIQSSTPDQPGLIMAKMNSLQDREISESLYRASQQGVKILLNIRGICCVRPGIKDVSTNIEVYSIIDTFLEHTRMFYFRNGGHEEIYLSSADWMVRNLSKRLELLFPITDPTRRRRAISILRDFFSDNVKSHRLLKDGTYERVARKGRRVRVQEQFYNRAVEITKRNEQATPRFHPLTRPQKK